MIIGAVSGGSIGVLVAIITVACLLYCCLKKKGSCAVQTDSAIPLHFRLKIEEQTQSSSSSMQSHEETVSRVQVK